MTMIRFLLYFEQDTQVMKCLRYAVPVLLAALILTGSADAQRKKTARKTSAKKPPVTRSIVPPLEVRTAREKVAIQRDNVNRFVDVLGPIAQGIETLNESRQLPRAAHDQNEANKTKVITAIRNLKDGLEVLESEFRTKTALQRYLPTIRGITDLAAQSEDTAIAGRFVASKDPLRTVGQKLTDTLAVLPFTQ